MSSWFSMLGREWRLSAAEIAALSPSSAKLAISESILVGNGPHPDWDRCGGVVRAGDVIANLDAQSPDQLIALLIEKLAISQTKQIVGISAPNHSTAQYSKLCKTLKLAAQAADIKLRVVRAQKGTTLNSGELFHNQIPQKWPEFLIWRSDGQFHVGQTNWVQDAADYTNRDRNRPARDARVGMLPPKLAQIMINLSGALAGSTIYDPFCGTGVVLLEALRTGFEASGSDLSPAMVEATQKNIAWWKQTYNSTAHAIVSPLDAARLPLDSDITVIVTEGWLGNPDLNGVEASRLRIEATKMSQFYGSVFQHWHQIPSLKTILIALPVWYDNDRAITLPILDEISQLGYDLEQFAPFENSRLIYRRPDQTVGRMIVKMTKL